MNKQRKRDCKMNNQDINNIIGANIKRWRKKRGLTLEALGMIVGFVPTSAKVAMSRIESGKGALMPERVVPLTNALQIPVSWLFVGVPGFEEQQPTIRSLATEEQTEMLDLLDRLSSDGRRKVLSYLKDLCATGLYRPLGKEDE